LPPRCRSRQFTLLRSSLHLHKPIAHDRSDSITRSTPARPRSSARRGPPPRHEARARRPLALHERSARSRPEEERKRPLVSASSPLAICHRKRSTERAGETSCGPGWAKCQVSNWPHASITRGPPSLRVMPNCCELADGLGVCRRNWEIRPDFRSSFDHNRKPSRVTKVADTPRQATRLWALLRIAPRRRGPPCRASRPSIQPRDPRRVTSRDTGTFCVVHHRELKLWAFEPAGCVVAPLWRWGRGGRKPVASGLDPSFVDIARGVPAVKQPRRLGI